MTPTAWRPVLRHAERELAWKLRVNLILPDVGVSWDRVAELEESPFHEAFESYPLLRIPPWRIDVLLFNPAESTENADDLSASEERVLLGTQTVVRFFADLQQTPLSKVIATELRRTDWQTFQHKSEVWAEF